jgi:hypothetical protein
LSNLVSLLLDCGLNQDGIWYTSISQSERIVLGTELVRGLEVALQGGDVLVIEVSAWNEPPYGETNK